MPYYFLCIDEEGIDARRFETRRQVLNEANSVLAPTFETYTGLMAYLDNNDVGGDIIDVFESKGDLVHNIACYLAVYLNSYKEAYDFIGNSLRHILTEKDKRLICEIVEELRDDCKENARIAGYYQ